MADKKTDIGKVEESKAVDNQVVDEDLPLYADIAIPILRRLKGTLPFDIFVERSKKTYTKIFKKNDTIDWGRVAVYEDKGIKKFYVTQEEYQGYLMVIEQLAANFVEENKDFTSEQAMVFVKEMISLTALELLDKVNVQEHVMDHATRTITACVKTLAQDPKGLVNILKLMKNQGHLTKHSTTVSIISIIFAKTLEFDSESSLSVIGMGAFLHDIGITKLPFDPEDIESLSPEEWREAKTHPSIGKQLIDNIKSLPSEVKAIVMQHHEQPNGLGYPNGLRDKEIYMPSKFVAIADSFSSLIVDRPFKKSVSPTVALKMMQDDQGKYDKSMLNTFAGIFIRSA